MLKQEINFTCSIVKFNLQLIVRFKNQKYTKKMSDDGFQGLMLGQQKCPVFGRYVRLSITHRKVMQIILLLQITAHEKEVSIANLMVTTFKTSKY